MKNGNTFLAEWANLDNADFYRNFPIDSFKSASIQGGLDNGCDVLAVEEYIKRAESILEVGAGYGRVLEYLIKLKNDSQLFAVEREPKLCSFLKQQYANKVEILCDSILNFSLKSQVDLIMYMWAGICEFSKKEQPEVIKKLAASLNPSGVIVLELIPISDKTSNATDIDPHNRVIESPYGYDFGYFPSEQEVDYYASNANLIKKDVVIYTTKTDKKRNLYILQKSV